jgi:SAM-dependent methyltransferase
MSSGSQTCINDFGPIADVYDELVDWAPYDLWSERLEEQLREQGLPPGGWILDAACGTGLSTLPWAQKGYNVVGTDSSELMLARARERLASATDVTGRVDLRRRNLLSLSLGPRFDAAVCMHSGLDYILEDADLAQAFRSLRGCLVEGGLLAFDKCLDVPSFYRDDRSENRALSCGRATFHYRWDRSRRLLEQRCTVTRTDGSLPARTEVVFHLKATPPGELVSMVTQAGFEVLEPPREFTVSDPGTAIFRALQRSAQVDVGP